MTSTSSEVTYQDVQDRIDQFMMRFKIATLLNHSGLRKVRGISPACVVRTVFQLAFVGRSIYKGIHTSGTALMRAGLGKLDSDIREPLNSTAADKTSILNQHSHQIEGDLMPDIGQRGYLIHFLCRHPRRKRRN